MGVASAIDLTRFVTAMDGTRQQFLSPATVAEFTAKPDLVNSTPQWNGAQRSDGWYGMGIFVQPDTRDLTWWHWGDMPGTDSVMLRNGRGWAALTNTMPEDTGRFMNALDVVLWNAHPQTCTPSFRHQTFQHPTCRTDKDLRRLNSVLLELGQGRHHCQSPVWGLLALQGIFDDRMQDGRRNGVQPPESGTTSICTFVPVPKIGRLN
jgi:hypothetical protein